MVMGGGRGNYVDHAGASLDGSGGGSYKDEDNGEEELEEDHDHKTITASGGGGRQRGSTMARRTTEEPSPETNATTKPLVATGY